MQVLDQNQWSKKMPEPTTGAAAAGGALLKYFGLQVAAAGAVAAALGFLVLWPKSRREGFARLVVTIMCSMVVGPVLVTALHAKMPDLFASAKTVAEMSGLDPAMGLMFVTSPLLVAAGLPGWWVVGGIVRWFEKRRDKDAGEMMQDAADTARSVLGK